MKMLRTIAPALVATMVIALPTAVAAQESEWPLESAEYVEVSGISVDDGHGLDYAKHLSGMWRKGQEFAKSQGWITGYEILYNVNPRKGEPDLYLLTRFTKWATNEEEEARSAAYRKHMAMTDSQMQTASQGRAEYRHLEGSMLLRRAVWK